MRTQFTYQEMIDRRGCYEMHKVARHEWMFKSPVQLSDMLNDSRISLVEKSWFVSNSCDATAEELNNLAAGCAEVVLPLWYNKYATEPTPVNAVFASPKLAIIVQAIHAVDPRDRIYAAARAALGTDKENELLQIFINHE